MSALAAGEPTCPAAANQRGEHIPCDLRPPHTGWAHSNRDHELLWTDHAGDLRGGERL